MPDYRLLHIQGDGDAVGVEEFFATSDEAALNFAITRTGSHAAELWCWSDRRFVALVARDEAQQAERRLKNRRRDGRVKGETR